MLVAQWWNIYLHRRANLALLPEELHLANDPWFVMKRENVLNVLHFVKNKRELTSTICNGGLANESLFAIILYIYKQLNITEKNYNIISAVTHATDWFRRSSSTSPHVFKDADEMDIKFIDNAITNNHFIMFIRKVSPEFPDEILNYYIYENGKTEDDKLVLKTPWFLIYLKYKVYIYSSCLLILLYIFRAMI